MCSLNMIYQICVPSPGFSSFSTTFTYPKIWIRGILSKPLKFMLFTMHILLHGADIIAEIGKIESNALVIILV